MGIYYLTELAGLFTAAFVAATLIPFSSEALLVFVVQHQNSWLLPLAVASTGNILGSLLNYYIGYKGKVLFFKRKKELSESSFNRASYYYQKYGVFSLLFAWLPIIGDPITIVAGIFQANLYYFVIFVSAGKISRYALLLYSIKLMI